MADENSGGDRSTVAARRPQIQRKGGDGAAPPAQDPNDIAVETEPEVPLPSTAGESSSLIVLAPARLAALGVALVLVVALTFVVLFHTGPPSVADLRARAGVDNWLDLPIGVKSDQPGISDYDADTRTWSGFDIDIAYMIAEDLGFRRDEVKFYGIESEDRARMQATDADGNRVPVKLVVASYTVTAARAALGGVLFSDRYLWTEQSVATLAGHPKVSTLADLRGQTVCTLSTSTGIEPPSQNGATVIQRNKISECFADLFAKKVDAVNTDAAIIAGYKVKYGDRLTHWDLGREANEGYGVNVGENDALRQLVNVTLYRSLKDPKDHRWEDAFQRNLQTEVAANKPAPIAVTQQPDVRKPNVRLLPWDGTYP